MQDHAKLLFRYPLGSGYYNKFIEPYSVRSVINLHRVYF